jgi:hypothetical protein
VPHRARCRRAPPFAVGPFDVLGYSFACIYIPSLRIFRRAGSRPSAAVGWSPRAGPAVGRCPRHCLRTASTDHGTAPSLTWLRSGFCPPVTFPACRGAPP